MCQGHASDRRRIGNLKVPHWTGHRDLKQQRNNASVAARSGAKVITPMFFVIDETQAGLEMKIAIR
jgi:hypothetical protein